MRIGPRASVQTKTSAGMTARLLGFAGDSANMVMFSTSPTTNDNEFHWRLDKNQPRQYNIHNGPDFCSAY